MRRFNSLRTLLSISVNLNVFIAAAFAGVRVHVPEKIEGRAFVRGGRALVRWSRRARWERDQSPHHLRGLPPGYPPNRRRSRYLGRRRPVPRTVVAEEDPPLSDSSGFAPRRSTTAQTRRTYALLMPLQNP